MTKSYQLYNRYTKSKTLVDDLFKLVNVLEKDCETMNMRQCQGTTKNGNRCQNSGKAILLRDGFCWRHK